MINFQEPVPLSVVTQLPTEPPPEPSHVAPLTRVEVQKTPGDPKQFLLDCVSRGKQDAT